MLRSYLFVMIAVVIYAGNLIVGKAINDLPPITISFFRTAIAFLVVLPFAYKQFKEHHDVLKSNWKPLLGIGITGIALFNVFVYLSLNFTTTTNAGIMEATTPVFTIILGYIFLSERLKKMQLFGVFISLIGAIWVLTNGNLESLFSLNYNIGDLFMIVAVIIWSIFSILVKLHNHKYPVLGGLLVMLGFGLVILIPLVIGEWLVLGFPSGLADFNLWLGLIYLGIFPSFIALMLWNKSVSDLGPSLSSVFLNFLPFFTAIGAIVFLDESLVMAQILGGLIVIFGVLLVNIDFKKWFNRRNLKQENKSA